MRGILTTQTAVFSAVLAAGAYFPSRLLDQKLANPYSTNASVSSLAVHQPGRCELPPCELILKSRLYSERCRTPPPTWPLLITGTPRSATVYAKKILGIRGMQIQDDWGPAQRDGRVSWIYAFEDDNNFGPARANGQKFGQVFHHVKEPLSSITSMCTEPLAEKEYADFLRRHIELKSYDESPRLSSRLSLEMFVHWRSFLMQLKLPTYQIENVKPQDIFRHSDLNQYYHEPRKTIPATVNSRKHREKFTWQELYTIDPKLATEVWEMAHHFGYSYPDVDFDKLTCLPFVPLCDGKGTTQIIPDKCPPGTHPYPSKNLTRIRPRSTIDGFKGWLDGGCIEYKTSNGKFVGLKGLEQGSFLGNSSSHHVLDEDGTCMVMSLTLFGREKAVENFSKSIPVECMFV